RHRPRRRLVRPDHREHPRPRRHARQHHREPVRRGQRHPPRRAHRVRGGAVRNHHPDQRGGAGGRRPDRPAVGRHGMSTSAMPLTQSTRKGRRELKNAVATALIVASFVIALIPLTFIIVYVTRAGATVFNLNFLTDDLPFSNRFEGGGIYPAIIGTLVLTGTATAI